MSAATACIVKCDGCATELVWVNDSGPASMFVGRTIAQLRGWKVPMSKDGLPSGRRSGKDYCPACVAEGVA